MNHFMRRTCIIVLLNIVIFFQGSILFAQSSLIAGYVKSMTNGIGIANHQVIIQSQIDTATSTGMNYYSTVFTASNGFFIDTVSIPNGQNIMFIVSTLDCQNNPVYDTLFTFFPHFINLLICDTGLLSCTADFLSFPDTANYKKHYFINMSTPGNGFYKWYFGDGDSSIQKNPVHSYNKDSLYAVSLTVYDPVAQCYNQKTDTINVSPAFYCNNAFSFTSNFLNASFSGTVNNSLPTIYNWNFGDFSTASGQNPTHIYSHAGIYFVKLQTISVNPQNLDTCISNSSKYINIQSPPVGNIWGQVFLDTSRAKYADVLLYKFLNSKDGFELIDSVELTIVDSMNMSFYYFPNIPYGQYITKARLSPVSSFYTNFGPAYVGNTFKWDDSKIFHLNQAAVNQPIHLTHIFQATGPVDVTGQVLEGNLKNPGDPIAGVLVYLYDVQDDVYGYTYTDANGRYTFTGLEYKKYYIHADFINKELIPAWVWPDESNAHLTHINIYVGENQVTSIAENHEIDGKIFPNPANDILNLLIKPTVESQFTIYIYNAIGQEVNKIQTRIFPDNEPIVINLSNIPKGLYTIKIESENLIPKSIKLVHY